MLFTKTSIDSNFQIVCGHARESQMNSLVPAEARFLTLGSKAVGKSGTRNALSLKSVKKDAMIEDCLDDL